MNPGDKKGQPDAKFVASSGDANIEAKGDNRRFVPQRKRTRLIILGVVLALIVIAVVVVVVVVVVTQSSENESGDEGPSCGPFSYPGINISDLRPKILSARYTCPLEGNCWTGKECYECFKLPEWKVGNINDIPVCCPQCLLSGLKISNSKCECLALLSDN